MLWEQISYYDESDIKLPKALAELFTSHSQKVTKKQNQTIITQSDSSTDVYYIYSGAVKISILAPNSKEYIFREIGRGNLIGELSAMDGEKRSVMVVTTDNTIFYKMKQKEFLSFVSQNREFYDYLMISLVKRVRNLSGQVFELSTMNVRCRIVLDLIRRAKRSGSENDRAEFSLPKDQTIIATELATHREAISREYSALAKSKLIEKKAHQITVPSIQKLETTLSKIMGF